MNIFDIIAQRESSGGINVGGPVTSSGQAQGEYQITTGTWQDFAPQAGISLTQYPTPNDAPFDVQTQVASVIPLSRWAPSTVQAVQSAYGPIDTSQTVGSLAGNNAPSGGVMDDIFPSLNQTPSGDPLQDGVPNSNYPTMTQSQMIQSLQQQQSAAANDALLPSGGTLEAWFIKIVIVLLGIGFLIVGAFGLTGHSVTETVTKVAKAGAVAA